VLRFGVRWFLYRLFRQFPPIAFGFVGFCAFVVVVVVVVVVAVVIVVVVAIVVVGCCGNFRCLLWRWFRFDLCWWFRFLDNLVVGVPEIRGTVFNFLVVVVVVVVVGY